MGQERVAILALEDEADILPLMLEVLEGGGYRAIGAETLDDACAVLMRETIDVLVCDAIQPPIGHLDLRFLDALRQIAPRITVILCSSRAGAEQLDAPIAELHSVIPKPFDIPELLAAVHSARQAPRIPA